MKVRVSFTVEIDPEAWTLNYGVEGAREISKDVKKYIEGGTKDHLNSLGVLLDN